MIGAPKAANMVEQGPVEHSFEQEWRSRFSDTPPLGWKLRAMGSLPWLRFHALPGSKRYPEDQAERRVVLGRAYELGDRVLGIGSACWHVEAVFDDLDAGDSGVVEFRGMEDGEETAHSFRVSLVTWSTGAFDAELVSIADDERSALWFRRSDGAVFAPYDGGFDLFPGAFEQVDELKRARPEWLSSHPSGL